MDLAAIAAFVAVGDTGGFRAAASVLGISSAGVSKAVARLEAQLGVALAARTTRHVRLTPAGVTFHARCREILAALEAASRDAAETGEKPRGRLVVAASRTFGRLRVLPVVVEFSRRYPEVDVEVRLSDGLVDLVPDGIDLAVRIGNLPDSGLVAIRVGRTGFVMCGSPAYLAIAGIPADPDALHAHDVVGYVAPDTAKRFRHRFLVDGVERQYDLRSRLTVDDGEALVSAAVRSAGLAMANDYVMEPFLVDGSLLRVLRDFELPAVPISVVHPPSRHPSAAGRAFTAMLRRSLAGTT